MERAPSAELASAAWVLGDTILRMMSVGKTIRTTPELGEEIGATRFHSSSSGGPEEKWRVWGEVCHNQTFQHFYRSQIHNHLKTTGFKPICETVINKGIEKLVTMASLSSFRI